MVFLVFAVVIGFGFVALALVRLTNPDESDDGDGSDGGPPRRGPGPRPRGPEPSWWPEFEREFWTYVQARAARTPVMSGADSG